MAAFFDQGAAGVGGKAVPVADLGIEGFAVLANAHLMDAPDRARMGHADHLGHRRHVAVFLRHPGQGLAPARQLHQLQAVSDAGAERLFGQDMQLGSKRLAQNLYMCVIRRGQHHGIAQIAVQQVLVVVKDQGLALQHGGRSVTARGMRVGQGRHFGAGQDAQILDMFAAHAAAADDAVADRLHGALLSE